MEDNEKNAVVKNEDKPSFGGMVVFNLMDIFRKAIQLPQLIVICLTICVLSGKMTSSDATTISKEAIGILDKNIWALIGWIIAIPSAIYNWIAIKKTIPKLRKRINRLKKGNKDSTDDDF